MATGEEYRDNSWDSGGGTHWASNVVALDNSRRATHRKGRTKTVTPNRPQDILVAIVIALAVVFMGVMIAPASMWLEVKAIRIANSVADTSPVILAELDVHQPVEALHITTVMQKQYEEFISVCTATQHQDFNPDLVLSTTSNLDLWLWPSKCILTPGQYLVKNYWSLKVFGFFSKDIRSTSNIFEVSPSQFMLDHGIGNSK